MKYERQKLDYKQGRINTDLHASSFPATTPQNNLDDVYISHKRWVKYYDPVCSPGLDVRAFSRGSSAFTTMLMFGLKSASYCTHDAATAANCSKSTRNKKSDE